MKKGNTTKNNLRMIIGSFVFLLVAAVPLYFMAEKSVRDELLVTAELYASELSIDTLNQLEGNRSDLEKDAYKNLKVQFREMQEREEGIAFVFLAGIRDAAYRAKTGNIKDYMEVFFYLDSEPDDSYDISLPGDIYDDASGSMYYLFQTGTPYVIGPEADAWGTWVSAITAVGGNTAETRYVFGIDYYAANYTTMLLLSFMKLLSIPFVFVLIVLVLYYRRKK